MKLSLEQALALPYKEKLRLLREAGVPANDPLLLEIEAIYERNPLEKFQPYRSRVDGSPKQEDFLASRARTKGFFAGDRAGKTEIGVVDNLIQALPEELVPQRLRRFKRWEPPFYCRIVFPKFGQGDLAVMDKLRELCPKEALRGDSFDKALEKQPNLRLHFKCGSWIVFNTGDQDRDVHAGVKLHRVHFDEEPQGERGWDIYQENRSRLVDFAEHPGSQMMFTMTPKNGLTWTYDEVWAKRDTPNVFCVTASMFDNPYVPLSEVEAREQEMSDEEARMAIHGEFVAFGGRVLDLRERHMIDPPSPEFVQRLSANYVVIDPGWRRAGVAWGGFDKQNTLIVYDELYPERLTPDQIVPLIQAKNDYWGVKPMYLIDPAARAGNLVTGYVSVEEVFNRLGIYPAYGQNDRLAGALQLKARLQTEPHPGLLVSRECRNLIWESERWVVASDEDAERHKAKVKGSSGSFATVGPDHICDGVRYLSLERLWYEHRPVQQPERWSPASGVTPPKQLVLGSPRRSFGSLGSQA